MIVHRRSANDVAPLELGFSLWVAFYKDADPLGLVSRRPTRDGMRMST